jgi:acetylglutamate kinase/acetylglutamate/LysW-gamma-L-alpha-aminoadipate kinase
MGEPGKGRDDLLVVKVGGSCLEELAPAWWDRLAAFAGSGERPRGNGAGAARERPAAKLVVVHGWSRMASAATPAGQPDFVVDKHGFRSRYTTPEVLAEIERIAAGLRERIAGLLGERGLRAVAVSGAESGLLRAEVRENMWWVGDELVALTNLVGPVREVDREQLAALLEDADALVVSPLAVAAERGAAAGPPRGGPDEADRDRGPAIDRHVNTDADRAAAAIAGAGGAERLVLAMDAEAVLADGEPVRSAARGDLRGLARHATGGMAKKLRAVEEAFAGGVREVAIGSAPVPDLLAARAGTLIAREPDPSPSR